MELLTALDGTPGLEDLIGEGENFWSVHFHLLIIEDMENSHYSRDQSPLGDPRDWNQVLKSFANFITTLPHPAAIYWGDELAIIQNAEWKRVAGSDGSNQQGASQREGLSAIAVTALGAVVHGSVRRHLSPSHLLKGNPSDGRDYALLLSPIVPDNGSISSSGAIAQLFPKGDMVATRPKSSRKPQSKDRDQTNEEQKSDSLGLDELPLDEHPFFKRFAAMLPTGLAILNHKAEAVFVNKQFYDLTTHREEDKSFRSWPQTIHPDDYDRVMKAYQDAFNSGQQLTCEFRTQGHEDHPWRLLLLTPLGDDNLRHASLRDYGGFICAIIDCTPSKLNELAQEKAAREAKERKEQQERFIDMISHEIRNPLSACLHCAEDIIETVEAGSDGSGKSIIATAGMIEAAETISLCVSHQKSLVDDILSFSKLDASMLSLSPKSVQPKRQLADSMKMFQPELRKQSMAFEYLVDYSYDNIHVDFVQADLVRISQVLV
jgi:PAS domain-containing protein